MKKVICTTTLSLMMIGGMIGNVWLVAQGVDMLLGSRAAAWISTWTLPPLPQISVTIPDWVGIASAGVGVLALLALLASSIASVVSSASETCDRLNSGGGWRKRRIINMAMLAVCLVVMVAYPAQAATVGLENLAGPISDWDYNDVELTVTGLVFHLIGPYTFSNHDPLYTEIPLPDGYLFDYAVVDSAAAVTFLSHQSAYNDTAIVKVGSAAWVDVPTSGGLSVSALTGTRVLFGIRSEGHQTYYSDPALNPDFRSHAAVTGIPEPACTHMAIGGMLVLLLLLVRRTRD